MTNERAIELLHRLQDEQFDGIHGDERREALSMAVRALEQNLVKESGGLVKDLVEDSSSDLISRQQAIEAFEPEYRTDWYTPWIIEVLEALPSAQPERKKGRWIEKENSPFYCSVCGTYQYSASWEIKNKEYNFCPRCGARMDGESDE